MHTPDGHSAYVLKVGNRVTVIETVQKITPQAQSQYLNQVWGGKMPVALAQYSPDVQVAMTEAITGNVITQSAAGAGGAYSLQTAWNKVMAPTAFHATGDLTPFINSLRDIIFPVLVKKVSRLVKGRLCL
jgi:hypothetical protein